jgi:hypothetical protein
MSFYPFKVGRIFTKSDNPDIRPPHGIEKKSLEVFAGSFVPCGYVSRPPANTPNPDFVKAVSRQTTIVFFA